MPGIYNGEVGNIPHSAKPVLGAHQASHVPLDRHRPSQSVEKILSERTRPRWQRRYKVNNAPSGINNTRNDHRDMPDIGMADTATCNSLMQSNTDLLGKFAQTLRRPQRNHAGIPNMPGQVDKSNRDVAIIPDHGPNHNATVRVYFQIHAGTALPLLTLLALDN